MIKAYCDGACRGGNPGNTSCAWAIFNGESVIDTGGKYLGPDKHTNNYAEYMGLICLLENLDDRKISEATIYCDSQLVVNQVLMNWSISDKMKPLHAKAYPLFIRGRHKIVHVRGHNGVEGNELVDKICNDILDGVENGPQESGTGESSISRSAYDFNVGRDANIEE